MKIRINGNFLRFRLGQSEVKTFAKEKKVGDSINFGNRTLTYQLASSSNIEHVEVDFDGGDITIQVPQTLADNWVNSELVGFENEDQSNVRILVEKDFQCLHKRPGEDESDNFPHPEA